MCTSSPSAPGPIWCDDTGDDTCDFAMFQCSDGMCDAGGVDAICEDGSGDVEGGIPVSERDGAS